MDRPGGLDALSYVRTVAQCCDSPEAVVSGPGSADVVTLIRVTVGMEFRDEMLESSKDLHGSELSLGW